MIFRKYKPLLFWFWKQLLFVGKNTVQDKTWYRWWRTLRSPNIVLVTRKRKLQELVKTLKISKEHVGLILREHLSRRKLFAKWVPRLELFPQDRTNFLHRYATMYETWVSHYTPEFNCQSDSGQQPAKLVQSDHKISWQN